jgi:hypothetical protein
VRDLDARRLGAIALVWAWAASTAAWAQAPSPDGRANAPVLEAPAPPPVLTPPSPVAPPVFKTPAPPTLGIPPPGTKPTPAPAPQTKESKAADAQRRELQDLIQKARAEIRKRLNDAYRSARAESDPVRKMLWDNYIRLLNAADGRLNEKPAAMRVGAAIEEPGALAGKYAGIQPAASPTPSARTATGLGSVGALCPGVLTASADATDPSTLCACGQKYLARLGEDARQLRQRVEKLVGHLRSDVSLDHAFTAQEVDALFKDARLLQEYTSDRRVTACAVWTVDRAKVGGLLKDRDRLRAEIAALTTDADRVWQKERVLIGQLDARVAGNDALKEQIAELGRQRRDLATKANGLRNKDLMDVLGRLALLDEDVPLAKSGTYSEVQLMTKTLWSLYLLELEHTRGSIQRDFNAEDFSRGEPAKIAAKWAKVWDQQLTDQHKRAEKLVYDSGGYANESIALCKRLGPQYAAKAQEAVRKLPPLADRLRATRAWLSEDLQRWGHLSARDGWPAADKSGPYADVGFEEWSRRVFLNSEFIKVDLIVGYAVFGPYREWNVIPPVTMRILGEVIDASVVAFWNEHKECGVWYGPLADGSIGRGFDVYRASLSVIHDPGSPLAPISEEVWRSRLDPPYPHLDLRFEIVPFKDAPTGPNVLFASGADDKERP